MVHIYIRGQGSSPPPELPDVADAMKPERLKHRVEPRASWTELPVAEMPERDDVKQKVSGDACRSFRACGLTIHRQPRRSCHYELGHRAAPPAL